MEKEASASFFVVRQAWCVARKRNQFGCGGQTQELKTHTRIILRDKGGVSGAQYAAAV